MHSAKSYCFVNNKSLSRFQWVADDVIVTAYTSKPVVVLVSDYRL